MFMLVLIRAFIGASAVFVRQAYAAPWRSDPGAD